MKGLFVGSNPLCVEITEDLLDNGVLVFPKLVRD